MALELDAKYEFAAKFLRVTPLNDDLSQPSKDSVLGGIGPFDFSGVAAIATVPLITKIDGGAAETVQVNLTAAVDQSAVTVAEMVTAITTAAPTDVTASADATTGRLKLVFASGGVVQAYGEAAELGLIGLGQGLRVISSDTFKSFTDTPTNKDSETFANTTVNGTDIEVQSDGFRKGTAGNFVDTAMDYLLRAMIEGGSIDSVTGKYSVPTSLSKKIYFKIEVFWAKYSVGTSLEEAVVGYTQQTIYNCVGSYGDKTRERGMTDTTYSYIATPYKIAGIIQPDSDELPLTVEAYQALDLENISA